MAGSETEASDQHPELSDSHEVIRQLRQEILAGRHWYPSLLQAVGRWEAAEETVNGRTYRYLISGEAFDWLVLAERLYEAVGNLLPETEMEALLFHDKPPLEITGEEFKDLIGETKYNQYLNYYYGITVEEALIAAVEQEVRKERTSSGLYRYKDTTPEAYRRIYGSSKTIMLRQFRKEKKYTQLKSIRLDELKEFTYWLFKHRLKQSDKARIASDTRKGLDWLKNRIGPRKSPGITVTGEIIDILP